ncbi:MAG: sulfite exporter TauE/SafE family protein [Bacteroidales bacterium]|nr:sulfite exporter TauE/SafE family protein [Bacteroidales bacterium]
MNAFYSRLTRLVNKQLIVGLILLLVAAIVVAIFIRNPLSSNNFNIRAFLDGRFFLFVLAGLCAQLVDGALGMAFGVSCSTLLIAFNVPPALSSASVHISEIFTTGASGISHTLLKNLHKQLFVRLLIPGVIGAVLGAYLLSEVFDGKIIKPFISAYLLILGLWIIYKELLAKKKPDRKVKHTERLALAGGLLDAIGGGGWGPVVTSNLIHKGITPKRVIGSVNTAEFFVTISSSVVFMFFIDIHDWKPTLGIIVGGLFAAPFAAYIVKLIKRRPLTIIIGSFIAIISIVSIVRSFDNIKHIIAMFY